MLAPILPFSFFFPSPTPFPPHPTLWAFTITTTTTTSPLPSGCSQTPVLISMPAHLTPWQGFLTMLAKLPKPVPELLAAGAEFMVHRGHSRRVRLRRREWPWHPPVTSLRTLPCAGLAEHTRAEVTPLLSPTSPSRGPSLTDTPQSLWQKEKSISRERSWSAVLSAGESWWDSELKWV